MLRSTGLPPQGSSSGPAAWQWHPTPGAIMADLEARFGSAPADPGGHLAYVAERRHGRRDNWMERKTVYDRLESGM